MSFQRLLTLAMNEDFFKALGARIAAARKELGLFQQQLADQLADQLGIPLPCRKGRRGPVSRPQQHIEAVEQLPKTKQQFISQMLDTVHAQAGAR
jgi:hypothetical protein